MSKDTKNEKNEKKVKNAKKEQSKGFMKELSAELKKVTWPTRKELISSTATVLFITILLAVIVFCLDFAFEKANTYGVEKLKSVVTTSENSEVPQVSEENTTDVESTTTDDATTDNTTETSEEATTSENSSTDEQVQSQENTAQ